MPEVKCRFQLEIDRPKSSVGYNMQELMFDGSRSKTSPPQGMRSDRQSVRTSPGTRDEKDIASYRKPFNFVKVPSNMSDTTSTKRVAAMISQPEKSLDAQQSSCTVLIIVLTWHPSSFNMNSFDQTRLSDSSNLMGKWMFGLEVGQNQSFWMLVSIAFTNAHQRFYKMPGIMPLRMMISLDRC
jgi:hypothetical protein